MPNFTALYGRNGMMDFADAMIKNRSEATGKFAVKSENGLIFPICERSMKESFFDNCLKTKKTRMILFRDSEKLHLLIGSLTPQEREVKDEN